MFRIKLNNFQKSIKIQQISSFFLASILPRNFSVTSVAKTKSMKVAVLGAGGRTGSCLSLFLKQSYLIDELAIYDKIDIASMALELSHIDTRCKINYSGNCENGLRETLEDAKIVIVTAGNSCDIEDEKKRENILVHADILMNYVSNIIQYCPKALLALVTSPVNVLIPFVAEIYKKFGLFDENRLFGVTTLNSVRANNFAADIMGIEPECVTVPVIGGNCSRTRVPIFSQTKPCSDFTHEEMSKLIHSVKTAEEQISRKYEGRGTSSLAMAFGVARFCNSLCKGLCDQRGVVEYAYVRSCIIPELTYFAGPIELGPCGIQKHLGLPPLTNNECKLLEAAIPYLQEDIKMGETLALGPRVSSTEICPPDPDPCNQEISGKMRQSNNSSQSCPP